MLRHATAHWRACVQGCAQAWHGAVRWWRAADPGVSLRLWLGTRLVYAAITYAGILLSDAATPRPALVRSAVPQMLLAWAHWDAYIFYLPIAHDGYTRAIDYAFFPLFPALIHAVAAPFGGLTWPDSPLGLTVAALLVSNAAALAAFILIFAFLRRETGLLSSAPTRGIRLFTAYPLAFFLTAPYPQALLVACAAGALLAARSGRWGYAVPAALLAGLTHVTGLALVVPLAVEYLRQQQERRVSMTGTGCGLGLVAISAAPSGVGVFALYCRIRTGDALAFAHAETTSFSHVWHWPWQTAGLAATNLAAMPAFSYGQARLLTDVLPLALVLLVTLVAARRQPLAFTLYTLALALLCLVSPVVGTAFPDVLLSAGRYLLLAFPLLLPLMRWCARWPTLEQVCLTGGWALQALLLAYYLRNGWLV